MKKILSILALFFGLCFAAEFSAPQYQTPLISVDEDGTATIVDAPQIFKGSSGVVLRKFESGDSSIIARVSVINKSGGFAKLRFEVFDTLEQKALPIPGVAPKIGDDVVLNFLYDRALVVAPNKEIYNEITEAFSNISFIHPDIVGAYLSYEYKPNPSRDDFRKMCAQSAAGLIFIALDKKSLFADCQSFVVLKEFESGEVDHYQLPFYTRVKGIDTIFYKLDAEHISNYDAHYQGLLEF